MTSVDPFGDGWRLRTPAGLYVTAVPDSDLSAWRLTFGSAGEDFLQIGPAPWYQECHPEPANGRLLLIGQHGKRHYSGVLTLDDSGLLLEFSLRWTSPLSAEDRELRLTSGVAFVDAEGVFRITDRTDAGWLLDVDGAETITPDAADNRTLVIRLSSVQASGTLAGRLALIQDR